MPRFLAPGGVRSRLSFGCWAVLGPLVLGAVSTGAAGATETGPGGAAMATQDGWWSRLQGPQEGEPAGNPVRPLVPPLPASPTVPGDTITVGASGGEVDKMAAVGMAVALPAGARLDALALRLKESPANAANVNADTAKVTACPAVTPWGPSKNAAWNDRPQADCALAQAVGGRGADGTWTFDLTPLGVLWTERFAPLPPYGVVLAVEPTPGMTQVSWLDFDSGNVTLDLVATMAPAAPPAASGMSGPAGDGPGPPGNPGGLLSADSLRSVPPGGESFVLDAAFSDPLAFPSASASATDVPSSAVAPTESPTSLAAAPNPPRRPRVGARPAVGFWEHIPTFTVLLLPLALGLVVLLGFALGPAGRPEPVFPRSGGLSRALARRKASGKDQVA